MSPGVGAAVHRGMGPRFGGGVEVGATIIIHLIL